MYQSHFRLERYPFQNTPDPAFFFAGQSNCETMAELVSGVLEARGLILLTGAVGTGKTTLVQALKADLPDQHIVIEINNPWISQAEILETIRRAILVTESRPAGATLSYAQVIKELKDRLIELDQSGRRVVLVVDEAHQLPDRTLEGIGLIAHIETPERKLIQIILLGQDELAARLGEPPLRAVLRRTTFALHLDALNRADTGAYIRHRLRISGENVQLFPHESIDVIHAASHGVPLTINRLCDFCLLTAYHRNAHYVDAEMAAEVATNMLTKPAFALPAPPPPATAAPLAVDLPLGAQQPPGRALPVADFMPPRAEAGNRGRRQPPGGPWRYLLLALLFGLAAGAAAIGATNLFL